jgi:hypothetical protein
LEPVGLLRLPRLIATAVVLCRLRGSALLVTAAIVGPILTETTATTVTAPTAMHAEPVLIAITLVAITLVAVTLVALTLVAITLIVTVLPGVLLWLTAAGYECRQATNILSAFVSALVRMKRLRLMLLTIVDLLVARWKWLSVARDIRLLLRLAWRVTRFVLAHESLAVVIVAVKTFIVPLLVLPARRALLRLLIVVGVLLAELFLRGGNETKIMFGVLVVILGGNRIAGALGIARKLDVFFRNVRSRAANFDVRAVRFVNARQRILAFAVVTASPHALLTISHVPVIAFCLSRR